MNILEAIKQGVKPIPDEVPIKCPHCGGAATWWVNDGCIECKSEKCCRNWDRGRWKFGHWYDYFKWRESALIV